MVEQLISRTNLGIHCKFVVICSHESLPADKLGAVKLIEMNVYPFEICR